MITPVKIGGQDVTKLNPTFWQVKIYRPIYGTCVALNDTLITKAIGAKAVLAVDVYVDGGIVRELINPSLWKKQAKRIEKVFNIPTKPMVMWQREVKGTFTDLSASDCSWDSLLTTSSQEK